MILILIAAAVVSGIVGDFKDTIVIAAIVVLNGLIGFIQEFRAERALEALQQMAAPAANVLRNGHYATIAAADVVPGDIIVLEAGGIVPADLRLLEAAQLRLEEAALTGESHPIEKTTQALHDPELPLGDRRNMAYRADTGRAIPRKISKCWLGGSGAAIENALERSFACRHFRYDVIGEPFSDDSPEEY
jgi:P-type Ca2+ transporter type 2C